MKFTSNDLPQSRRLEFLYENFTVITKLQSLPPAILESLGELHGSRLVMANPGEHFLATDLVVNENWPWRRLIFAGMWQNRCFIYFEHGGRASHQVLAAFRRLLKAK